MRDIAPVAGFMRVPNVMEVHPSVPAKTVAEFIAYAKANPGKINMASSGNGTSVHLSGELFKLMTGVEMTARAVSRLGAGAHRPARRQVQVMFDNMPASICRTSRPASLRALAVTTAKRSEALPDVPTVAETVPGYEASAWFGIGAPKGTPREIVELLNKEINEALNDPKMLGAARRLGGILIGGTPDDFGKVIADGNREMGKVVKRAANLVDGISVCGLCRVPFKRQAGHSTIMTTRKRPEDLRSHRWLGVNDLRSFGHRSRLRQIGYDAADWQGKPVIGIINTWSDINPCHAHLRERAENVKRGVLQAGGFPIELPAMSLSETFVKPTTMLYRNFLAMETEELLRSHPIDGAVLMGGCDKTTPGLIMGAISMGIPAIYVPAGPMLRGNWRGQ